MPSKTHKEQWNLRHGFPKDKSHSLASLARVSKYPVAVLQEVYNRGVGAHATNPRSVRLKRSFKKNVAAPLTSKLSKEQWGYARIYAFLNKIETKQLNHDVDLKTMKKS